MDFLKSLLLAEARVKDAAMNLVYQAADATPKSDDKEKYMMAVVAQILLLDKDKLFKGDAVEAEKMAKQVLADKVDESADDTPRDPTRKEIDQVVQYMDRDAQGPARLIAKIARFKSYDVDMENKVLYWVTQETGTDEEKREAAEGIAREMADRGYIGWTVKVTIRDDYNGKRDDNSKWQTALVE